jgi:uncharacterized membrane protein
MLTRWRPLLIVILQLAAIMSVLATTDNILLRSLASVPLVFYLPGSALLNALRLEHRPFPEWHALTTGLSMAVTISAGLVINAVATLTPRSWTLCLGIIILTSSFIAAATKVPSVGDTGSRKPLRAPSLYVGAIFAVSVIVTAATFNFAVQAEQNYRPFQYTEFWLVPSIQYGPDTVTIGVTSQEAKTYDFDIEVRAANQTIAVWRSVTLMPGQSLIEHIAIPSAEMKPQKVQARLFRSDDPAFVYREVWVVLDSGGEPRFDGFLSEHE